MRWVLGLSLACGWAVAEEPSGFATFRERQRALTGERLRFWRAFQERQIAAWETFEKPWDDMRASMGGRGTVVDFRVDLAGYHALCEEAAGIERRLGAAYLELAASGHEKALATLFGEMIRTCADLDRIERELAERRVGDYDQEAVTRRYALTARCASLVEALGAAPDAVAYLSGAGYKRAARAERGKSCRRRVIVLDGLRAAKDPAARDFLVSRLADDETAVRIAAAEALAALGPETIPDVAPCLRDEHLGVRRAALALARDPRWIGPLVATVATAKGRFRAECFAALRRLGQCALGNDPDAWRAWYEANRVQADAGQAFPPDPDTEIWPVGLTTARFYGIPLRGERIVFILDWGDSGGVPARYDVQKTRVFSDWAHGNTEWRKQHESHAQVQTRELLGALERLPEDARFALIVVNGWEASKTLGARRPLKPTKADRRRVRRFLSGLRPDGFRSEYETLDAALALPFHADTVVLVGDGVSDQGRCIATRAALEVIRRRHRFRRFVVHTVRVCNGGPEAEAYLKGLASITGGEHHWAR